MVLLPPGTDTQKLWQTVQELLRTKLSQPSFETWISPLCIASIDTGSVTLFTESMFNRDWILKNYRSELRDAFTEIVGNPVDIQLAVRESGNELLKDDYEHDFQQDFADMSANGLMHQVLSSPHYGTTMRATENEPSHALSLENVVHLSEAGMKTSSAFSYESALSLSASNAAAGQGLSSGIPHVIDAEPSSAFRPWTPRSSRSQLNPKYVFDNFVIGQHNRFCHAAALAVAEAPAKTYNPFFIYGGVGLGKTHLIQAIGHTVLCRYPDLTVKYVTTEQFTNDLIGALGNRNMQPFREKYRQIDVLIIDDIQFLEGKERTQEEIFHTFNALYESGKQVILSSDRPPRFLSRLEDRLRSRFESGLIADIQPPDVETRVAILQKKLERDHLNDRVILTHEVLEYVADLFPNNIRELEGGLNKVAAYAMLTRTPVDMASIKSILGAPVSSASLSLDRMIEIVAEYYHLRATDLKSPSRAKDLAHARHVSIYVLRTLSDVSFPKIGEVLGGRKHTTILYAYEKIKDELEHHPVLARQIQEITQRIQNQYN